MPESTDADLTLPSVVAAVAGKCRRPELVLTIIFHPRISRIGQSAVVPWLSGNKLWTLGRRSPAFGSSDSGDDQAAGALDDQHVSRVALEFQFLGKKLIVRRPATSSRCRIAGGELATGVELNVEQLQQGVPLMLGHVVVLLLRLGQQRDQGSARESLSDELLRGSSAYMHGLRQQISVAAGSDLDVLIRGETGTGKELVAATIHSGSCRASAPLICVNMAAIPAELAPAALFGSAKGAFTGADRAGVGYFVQAQGGSLFLDEIGDTAQEVQPQLLRALQQREVQAVGGPIRRVDLRVISATDAPLDEQGGSFKAALRHRLGACEIHLQPLREHPEDIGELLLYFLTTSADESQRADILPSECSTAPNIAAWAGLFYRFLCYRWPGNVRELANFARQVVLASEHELTLVDNIEAALQSSPVGPPAVTSAHYKATEIDVPRRMQDIGEDEFDLALQHNRFEAARVARQLGVSRTAVYRRIEDSSRHRLVKEVPASELQRVLADNHGDPCATALQLRVSQASLRIRLRYLA